MPIQQNKFLPPTAKKPEKIPQASSISLTDVNKAEIINFSGQKSHNVKNITTQKRNKN